MIGFRKAAQSRKLGFKTDICEQENVCLHFQKEVPENQASSEARESVIEMWIFYHHLFELGLLYF